MVSGLALDLPTWLAPTSRSTSLIIPTTVSTMTLASPRPNRRLPMLHAKQAQANR